MSSIYLSPSKQENNKGVGNYGTEEKRMNEITDVICKCLDASKVKWFRNNPSMESSEIARDSNSKKPDFHFAIHSNAGGGEGAECLVYSLGGKAEKFAKIIYNKLVPMTPSTDRGIKVVKNLAELRQTVAPACLVEIAFHDDKEDAKFIVDNIQKIGIELSEGICKYFNVGFVNPYKEKASNTIYRVQVGAYETQAAAIVVRKRLKLLGYDSIIV